MPARRRWVSTAWSSGASVMMPLTSAAGRTVKGEAAPIFSALART